MVSICLNYVVFLCKMLVISVLKFKFLRLVKNA